MDIFENKVSEEKFKSTNSLWNKLHLCESWSLGFVSQLIKEKKFKTKEEWYDFYFKSGQERLNRIKLLSKEEQDKLLCGKSYDYNGENKNLNLYYGRTKQEIAQKGNILYNEIVKQGNPLNLEIWECQFIAFFRTVCETWNGVMIREITTKENIENHFYKKGKYISLIDTSGRFDYNYAVDFEVYVEGNIVCGIQIKPKSYMNQNISYIKEAHEKNTFKNKKYEDKFNRKVFYIYSSQNGYIHNSEVLKELEQLFS